MSDTKWCPGCREFLPVTAFQKCARDGYQARCRQCRLDNQRANREGHKARDRRWREANPERTRERTRRYREAHNEKRVAHWKVGEAVQRGELQPIHERVCVRCGVQAEHYHHDSYDRPLDVTPVCSRCHNLIHLELKS